MNSSEESSDNDYFNYSTFINVAKKVQSKKEMKEQTDPVKQNIKLILDGKNIKKTSSENEVKEEQVKIQTSENLAQRGQPGLVKMNNKKDFNVDKNSTKTKTESEESSSASSSDESEVVPPSKPVKPLSETRKAMSISQSVLHGEAKFVNINRDLNKEKVPKKIEYMDANKGKRLCGHVMSKIANECVIIEALKNSQPLMVKTELFMENLRIIGPISEILGPVDQHMSAVVTENTECVNIGDRVYCEEGASYEPKADNDDPSDASWVNDQECPPKHKDYSDDEKEQAARKQRRIKRLKKRND